MMLTLIHRLGVEFFDAQMHEDLPKFIAVLVALNSEIIMTSKKINSLNVDIDEDGDEEVTIYDQMCDLFIEFLFFDSLKLGVDFGVFKERDGYVDLTPEIAA
jgi:hypothetical protein